MKLRKCPKCNKVLPIDLFAPNTKYCKVCRRDYDWQYRYGLSPEQYLDKYIGQNGKCKICGREPAEGEYLQVDHDHETREVRGLLCSRCNKAIGFFEEDLDIITQALKYLEEKECQEQ